MKKTGTQNWHRIPNVNYGETNITKLVNFMFPRC